MAKQTINLGTPPGGTDGDTSRVAFSKSKDNFDELYARTQGKLAKDVAGAAGTLNLSALEAQNGILELTGALTGNRIVTVPASPPQTYIVRNGTTGNFTLTFQTVGGTGVLVAQGQSSLLYSDGTNVVDPIAGAVAAAVAAAAGPEIGRVTYFPLTAPPAGYLRANGAAVSRTTYATLFAKIGTTFGAGDGTTTFNVPDLRGEFVRGWDDGRGVDPGRSMGTVQAQSFQGHTHTAGTLLGSIGGQYSVSGGTALGFGTGGASGSTNGGADETRPRNMALLACIRYA
jgi:hypothetical protein